MRAYESAHGISSWIRRWVGHRISRGRYRKKTDHPQMVMSRHSLGSSMVRRILPRRWQWGHRQPFLCGFTHRCNSLFLNIKEKSVTKSSFKLSSFRINLFTVIDFSCVCNFRKIFITRSESMTFYFNFNLFHWSRAVISCAPTSYSKGPFSHRKSQRSV